MPDRPLAVAFDVNGTLFPIEPLRAPLGGLGLPHDALETWFAMTIRDGAALAAAGAYRPFQEVARGALEGLLARRGTPAHADGIAAVFEAMSRLPARPDAAEVLTRLRNEGIRVLALTNGSRKNTKSLLDHSGLAGLVERVLSIDDIEAWKPRPEVYHYAAREAKLDPGRLALVAAHAWDCQGAARAGLVTGWVSTPESQYNPAFGAPDVEGPTLSEVVGKLIGLGP